MSQCSSVPAAPIHPLLSLGAGCSFHSLRVTRCWQAGDSKVARLASRVLMSCVARKRAEKSMILIGLRGVGKTVLLNEIERLAWKEGHYPILVEAVEKTSLGKLLVSPVRKALFGLDAVKGVGDKVRRALIALRNFPGTIKFSYGEFGIDLEPVPGVADSGDIESDIPDLLIALAEAAGLPILPRLAGKSKSYAERRFLRAMAEAGDEMVRQKDVAAVLGKQASALSPVRSRLIEKGMIYSPRYGCLAFTVPLFGDFLRRSIPLACD